MALKEYIKKRDLKKSGEPSVYERNNRKAKNKKSERGHEQEAEKKIPKEASMRFSSEAIKEIAYPHREGRLSEGNRRCSRFVIHKHSASHLHWDLRLQMRGVLKSWAIPKQPPRSKNMKRLAIQVEDHPLSYADFEGEIPEGHYGAGKVEIWDKGKLKILEADNKKIEFELHGKKLSGKYVLVKTHYGNKPEKSWLFFRV